MITYSTVLRIIMMITIVIKTIYGEVDFGEICLYVYIYRVAFKTLRKSTDCSEAFKYRKNKGTTIRQASDNLEGS